ncbi:Odorant receptor 67 [Blattella germanica]|nr:Odorant receptor 67 [Blattella germanica]
MEDSSKKEEMSAHKYLGAHLALLEAGAMWPLRKLKTPTHNQIGMVGLIISVICQILLMIMEQGYLYSSTSDPLEIIAYIGTACLRIEALGKLLYMLFIRKKVKNLLQSLDTCFKLSIHGENEGEELDRKEEVFSIMKSWSYGAKIMAVSWTGLCTFGGTQWALVPFGINGYVTVTLDGDEHLHQGNLTNFTEIGPRTETFYLRVLPLRGWYPFNETLTPAYETIFLIQGIGNICTAFAVGIFDQFYCAVALLLCGQFECLKNSLRNINIKDKSAILYDISANLTQLKFERNEKDLIANKNDEFSIQYSLHDGNIENIKELIFRLTHKFDDDLENDYEETTREKTLNSEQMAMEDELKACIKHHQKIVSCASELNMVYSPMMFMQCQKSLLALCLVAFQSTMVNGDLLQLFSLVGYVMLLVIQLFLFCWCASELTERGKSVQDAAYDSGWPDANFGYKSSLIIMIHNCQVPILLTGGAFYILTMELFIELLRLSFSTYTVLKEMHEGQQD